MENKCKCDFCNTYDQFKWAEIMNCKCACHDEDGLVGHDGLCCSIPNALKRNNPYKQELDFESLKIKMNEYENEDGF